LPEQPISGGIDTVHFVRFRPEELANRLLNRGELADRLLARFRVFGFEPHQFHFSQLPDHCSVEPDLHLRLAAGRLRLDRDLARCLRLLNLVRGQWVSIRRPPNLESGLTLLRTLDIFGLDSRDCALCLQLPPPLDHVPHALVQVSSVVVSSSHCLDFRRDMMEHSCISALKSSYTSGPCSLLLHTY